MGFGSGGEQAVRKVERIDANKLAGNEKTVGSAITPWLPVGRSRPTPASTAVRAAP
ncbi:MAG: hypothetical protein R2855_01515 [Thermomicrobiales bacterium]